MTFTPSLLFFIFAALIIGALIVASWKYRHDPTGRYFSMLMGCAFVWVFFFIFETVFDSLIPKLIFARVEFLGIMFLPAAWIVLIVGFTGQSISTSQRFLILFLPTLSTLILWTNPLHHWFMGNPTITTSGVPFPILNPDYKFWFYYIHAPGSYLYIAVSLVLLIRYLLQTEPVYKIQARILLVAILLPSLTDILYVAGITPISHYNFTTAVFSLSGLLLFWALFRFRFLDLLPLARDMVINNLNDGVLVLDYKSRLVYANQTAKSDFSLVNEDIGQPLESLQNECVIQLRTMLAANQTRMDIGTGAQCDKFFDVQLSPVYNYARIQIGYVATLHDVTERVHLYTQAQALSIQDSLTGIANRRHFFTACNRMLDRFNQHNGIHTAAVLMIDLDDFKQINDTYGHATGDKMLIAFATKLQSTLRREDLFGRLGGDEFSLLLMDVSIKESAEIAERIRKTISAIRLIQNKQEIRITASIGIVHTSQAAAEQIEIENLLQLADEALYQGKAAGKNYVQYYKTTL